MTAASDLTIPLTDSMDPANANYLKVATGMAMPNCVNLERSFTGQDAPYQLYSMLMGHVDTDKLAPDTMTCRGFNMTPVFTDADFSDWHLVTMRAPKLCRCGPGGRGRAAGAAYRAWAGEATTRSSTTVAGCCAAKELVLTVPRIGFFSTPSLLRELVDQRTRATSTASR